MPTLAIPAPSISGPVDVPPARRAGPWVVAGFAVAAVVGVALSLIVVTGEPLRNAGWALLVRLAVWAVVWGVGVLCALRLPPRVAIPAVFVVALALRLASLAGQPILSDDLYRYTWD